MADDRFRNDPYRPLGDNDTLGAVRQDARLQPDPELGEGPASSGKIALFAVAIALVLGALFYGLNNTSVNQATTDTTTRSAQTQTTAPAAPTGMRDVTPRTNTAPGVTTGAAPSQPAPSTPAAPADGNK
jgi:zona occludens toxin (predicted ATPase)